MEDKVDEITPIAVNEVAHATTGGTRMIEAGRLANDVAAQYVFDDYLNRKALNTLRAQLADLGTFAEYLESAGIIANSEGWAKKLQSNPSAWRGVTWGLIEGFVKWMLAQGYATGTINRKLSTAKGYAKLSAKAGAISADEAVRIKAVTGYSVKEGKRVDVQRPQTRVGAKKAQHVALSYAQAQQLKRQPNTPQGRRDTLVMCLILEHGLRVGEVALLKVDDIDLTRDVFTFFRPKVDAIQTHLMTDDTLAAVGAWFNFGDAPAKGRLLRGSRKNGELTHAGLSERAITARVRLLGEQISIADLSAHDCRHYWATRAAEQGTDAFVLRDAGGWSSIAMPSRYVESSKIANKRVKL